MNGYGWLFGIGLVFAVLMALDLAELAALFAVLGVGAWLASGRRQ